MPRSLEEIIEHAEELADMFEQLDPDDLRIVPLGEEFLRRAVMARARAERGCWMRCRRHGRRACRGHASARCSARRRRQLTSATAGSSANRRRVRAVVRSLAR